MGNELNSLDAVEMEIRARLLVAKNTAGRLSLTIYSTKTI